MVLKRRTKRKVLAVLTVSIMTFVVIVSGTDAFLTKGRASHTSPWSSIVSTVSNLFK